MKIHEVRFGQDFLGFAAEIEINLLRCNVTELINHDGHHGGLEVALILAV